MEETYDLLNEVYTSCWVSKEDVLEEKMDLIQHYGLINMLMCSRFSGNRNLAKALEYFNFAMQDFFSETEFEDTVYEGMIAYFEQFEQLIDGNDQKILEEFKGILEEFDSKVDRRFYESEYLYEHYMDIIESGILTDKNFYYKGLSQKTDEEHRAVILGKIPEVKQNV